MAGLKKIKLDENPKYETLTWHWHTNDLLRRKCDANFKRLKYKLIGCKQKKLLNMLKKKSENEIYMYRQFNILDNTH